MRSACKALPVTLLLNAMLCIQERKFSFSILYTYSIPHVVYSSAISIEIILIAICIIYVSVVGQ